MDKSKIKRQINYNEQEKVSPNCQDEINLELSRTYFGGEKNRRTTPERRNLTDRRNLSNNGQNNSTSKRYFVATITILVILCLLVGSLLLILFINDNKTDPTLENISTTPKNDLSFTTKKNTFNKPVPMVSPLKNENGEYILYDFENNDNGWGIPAWALNLRDHVAISTEQSSKFSSYGNGSLRVDSKFPNKEWAASLVEVHHFLNLENFDIIAADVFFPSRSSKTLRGIIILTQGENWEFNEMSHSFRINPGEWTTIWANISENSVNWKMKKLDPYFKNDIRKIAIRVESTKTHYKGPIYIDNIRVYSKDKFNTDSPK